MAAVNGVSRLCKFDVLARCSIFKRLYALIAPSRARLLWLFFKFLVSSLV